MTRPVGIGVVGGRSFVATRAVLPAIEASPACRLAAIAARSGDVDDRWAHATVDDYDDVLAHPDVDAVYLPLPNGLHRHWVERAAAAGKHVLCEKPLAPDAATARAMADTCRSAGVLLAEAWMTPFDPRWAHAIELARRGEVGPVRQIEAAFTFTIGPDAAGNYRWRADQGGGALLDVGIYCLGAPVELWGTADVTVVDASCDRRDGVDAWTTAQLEWPGGRRADIRCSFVDPERQLLVCRGERGTVTVDGDAFTGGSSARRITVERAGTVQQIEVEPGDPYLGMIEAFAATVRGDREWPRPVERSIDLLHLLDRIREQCTP